MNKLIYICDDEAIVMQKFKYAAQFANFPINNLTTTFNSQELLLELEKINNLYTDVVIFLDIDIFNSELNGFELLNIIRNKFNKKWIICILSVNENVLEIETAKSLKANCVVIKTNTITDCIKLFDIIKDDCILTDCMQFKVYKI